MEEVGQHRGERCFRVGQRLHLEALHVIQAQPVVVGVEQAAVRAFQRVGLERLLQAVRLEQDGEAGQRALLARRRGERAEGRPDRFLRLGRGLDAFLSQQVADPLRRPGPLARLVDRGQRLEGERWRRGLPLLASEPVVGPAQRDDRGAGRAAEVKQVKA